MKRDKRIDRVDGAFCSYVVTTRLFAKYFHRSPEKLGPQEVREYAGRLVGIVTMEDILQLLTRALADLAAAVIGARDREFEQRV